MNQLETSVIFDPKTDAYPSRVYAEPRWLPRQDPIVYGEWNAESGISKEHSDFYAKNGYLFLENFFGGAELKGYQEKAQRLREASRNLSSDEIIRQPGGEEVHSIFAIHRTHPVFQELSRHPRLLAIVEHVLGGPSYIHQSRINYKPAFTGKEFYWHSDFETWHVEDGMPRMRALSCLIALEDNYPFNGPLMVMPGSHQIFVSCVGQAPDDCSKEFIAPDQASLTELAKRCGIETPVGKAGSVLLFDCNLMHGSNSNITPYPRSNIFMVYNSVANKLAEPYFGKKPRPEYMAARTEF
ncbi:phytanoyl-CoA dioxygenase family protein [Paenibacillus macerans]|uniref:Ectoine hydroxylase n=1 Tax=Paenibacillus macerans TaxID=44252 RepID=A0A6N8EPL9_PAEMA|nr:phytanoyl-CoA dioxygenase family protein [Paenibacillus macerans]MCY7562461.1 phytanoyl-CoA dioxygenase family protein [Paenibacillus macerans]MEC0141452.1 phytanoyl-CoA dioxygenase family protein [Paenibacillus macerans]MEC0152870.1 phytanoyl-CoA dioxygenase family protein [Paenibacillus macerans]MUG21535.1 ectoine hydroxylase [Paenibacillus macerans]UMV46166.1 phytanoyl-CoA dioxygenase family protein [Paenibacillus macerans]